MHVVGDRSTATQCHETTAAWQLKEHLQLMTEIVFWKAESKLFLKRSSKCLLMR